MRKGKLQEILLWLIGPVIVYAVFSLVNPSYLQSALFGLFMYVILGVYLFHLRRGGFYVAYERAFKLLLLTFLFALWQIISHYKLIPLSPEAARINWWLTSFAEFSSLIGACYYAFWKESMSWSEMTNREILWTFSWYAKLWGRLQISHEGESEKAKRCSDYAWRSYLELKKRDPRLLLMEKLLTVKDDGVKLLSARHLLWTNEEEALRTLEELQKGHGEIAKMASELMSGWKAGEVPTDEQLFEHAKATG